MSETKEFIPIIVLRNYINMNVTIQVYASNDDRAVQLRKLTTLKTMHDHPIEFVFYDMIKGGSDGVESFVIAESDKPAFQAFIEGYAPKGKMEDVIL